MTDAAYPNWDAVYRDNVTWVYRLMYGKVGNQPDAEDLTAEVFMTALRPLRVSASVPEVRKYLKMTARTVLASYWGDRMGREVTSIDDDLPEPEEPESVVSDAPDKVRSLLARLPRQLPAHPGTALLAGLFGAGGRQSDGGERRERESVAVPCAAHGGANEWGGDDVSGRTVRRFVEGLLRGQPTARARPDDFEAQEMKTAIELRAARLGSDSPREEFVTDLHRRLAEADGRFADTRLDSRWAPSGTRRQVVIGTGLAAASAAAGMVVGRTLLAGNEEQPATPSAQGVLEPNAGAWRAGRCQRRLPRGWSGLVRPRIGHGVRSSGRLPTRGGIRNLHAPGLQAVA